MQIRIKFVSNDVEKCIKNDFFFIIYLNSQLTTYYDQGIGLVDKVIIDIVVCTFKQIESM